MELCCSVCASTLRKSRALRVPILSVSDAFPNVALPHKAAPASFETCLV